ncbi:LYR motif-containing protein 4B isoform X1 [Poecilia formosa]|uniref:LYR motif-containing protein 4B isoform X1 n=1 Tax=Poecilia formosa TaxID=48698 RepID=UPI0007B9B771|nr:PREDICTED: LYR motif-containing protein 4 isoform X1 [Poecilia formosa]
MAASTRSQVISLYKVMLKESSRFPSYNYRTYALRRVRDAFRANREVEDPKAVERLMDEGEQMLALIQRQTFRRRKALAATTHQILQAAAEIHTVALQVSSAESRSRRRVEAEQQDTEEEI